jgi:hypothetical protein
MPTAASEVTSDEPPKLINGNGTPVKGIASITEPILIIACNTIQDVMPVANSEL